jgi:hypothetical protein
MKVTLQQKITFGVLGLAAIAFVVDRCTSTPAPASASAVVRPVAKVGAAVRAAVAKASINTIPASDNLASLASFSERLQQIAGAEHVDTLHVNDAFVPSVQWAGARHETDSDAADRLAAANQFREHHKLIAVMLSGKGGIALLDGKPLRPGQLADGFKLTELHERSAVFTRGQAQVQLNVVAPATTSEKVEIQRAGSGEGWQ